ncbi:hypothetical protein [Alkalihalobacillus deserti]|uniref:hypothetical protein n=1 Tax=Alkalihalobacillus deserti TaxID=2879466 RepID=UPI001D13DD29|nr:hypothetical protein [Alkalihalobacillus deserti]
MKKLKYLILSVLAISFLISFFPSTSFACSCVAPPPVEELLGGETAIFSGIIRKVTVEDKPSPIQSSADQLAVLVEVNQTWKGIVDSDVIVYTARSSASCGFEFQVNSEYLIYAHESADGFEVSLCSRTALVADAQDDLYVLGEGQTPSVQQDFEVEAEIKGSFGYLLSIFVAIAIIGSLFFIKRRKK